MEELKAMIKKEVELMGYFLYNLNFNKRGKDHVLSIEIDHVKPIGIDDCVKVSEQLSEKLDELNPIDDAYMLEVTSAGAEHELRNLEELKRAEGKLVHIKTIEQTFKGILVSATEASVEILDKQLGKTITIFQSDIENIRLAIDF